MAARATGSGTISFGLVSIPVKFYTATSSHRLAFHMLHSKCGTRVHMQYYCPRDEEVVSRDDLVRGYEDIKLANVERYRAELARALDRFAAP